MSGSVTAGRPTALRYYVSGIAALGIALFGWCVTRVASDGLPVAWWMVAALTFVSGRITLIVPGVDATFTVSEVFAFTSVLLFGPEAGAVTLALDCLVLAWHRRMRSDKAAFNFGNLTLAVWASGTLFFAVSGATPLLHGGQAATLILPLALLALTYFVINTGLIAAAIGFETGTGPVVVWWRHFIRLAPGYAASASLALHAPIGAEILSATDFPYPVVPVVRHHHENWDGTGYPDRIAGADIPIGARILSVVDCFDALTSDRPYRKRMTDEEALTNLRERRGTMYDPLVVDVFAASYKRIMPSEEAAAHPAAKAVGGARETAPAILPTCRRPTQHQVPTALSTKC